ncbi:MAG TPA: alanine--tRNA ligase-related protein, partial [Verrucomicrobiae bacterium]|nr:alanine--tRNA ligase-related protein [Verrucomicrobiae bacterium]
TDRHYVLRRILRRAVRYGRTLGFREPFFHQLVDVLAETMGDVFPEIRARKKQVQEAIRAEEEAFNKTLDKGIEIFEHRAFVNAIIRAATKEGYIAGSASPFGFMADPKLENHESQTENIAFQKGDNFVELSLEEALAGKWRKLLSAVPQISGKHAFDLYDTYGFPLDLTELMARERGLTVDKEGFEKLMAEQRARARAAQKKEVISVSQIETTTPTTFVGYEKLEAEAKVIEVVSLKDKTAVVLDVSPFYAEMGGQVGDTGEFQQGKQRWRVTNTQKSGNTWLHFIEFNPGEEALPARGSEVTLRVDRARRHAIQRHHTVTHLLHWALHEVVSREAAQKGSYVGPEKLTFDFNSAPLTPQQIADIEKLVNARILENAAVSWTEVPYAEVKLRRDVMQFFGEKYGERVRVVQIGGRAGELDGYSMELCGGTHVRATGEIGLFRIVSESAVAAGVRRIEAVAGFEACKRVSEDWRLIKTLADKINAPVHDLEKRIESLLAHQKELEKQLKAARQREAASVAERLLERVQIIAGIPVLVHNAGRVEGDFLLAIQDSLKSRFQGVMVLGGAVNGAVSLIASVSPDFTARIQAGKIIQQIAPIVGGKGGGRPDHARGGGPEVTKLDEALARVKALLG